MSSEKQEIKAEITENPEIQAETTENPEIQAETAENQENPTENALLSAGASDSDVAYSHSEEVSTNYTNESLDSDDDFESRLAAFAEHERNERNKYTLIRPEDFGWDHITIQERYQYFINIGMVDKPTCLVHQYFKNAILESIRDKQWFAYWEAQIPINGQIEVHPCIVKVNCLEDDLMANCTYHRSYDCYDSFVYTGCEEALLRENEIKYFLEKNCIPFMHLSCPVFYISDSNIDDEVTARHLEDLESISLLLDYCRFWDTVIYREWDEEEQNTEIFRADLEKRLKLYQSLHDGTMNQEQKLKYYQIVSGYDEWRDYLEQIYESPEISDSDRVEYIFHAKMAVYKCRKMQDFLESVDQEIPYTNANPLVLNRRRYSGKDVIHLVNGMPTFNSNEVKYATVRTDPEITEVLHHETVLSALETCYENDVVCMMAGDYDIGSAVFDQNCIVRGLPWRMETDPTSDKPKIPEDGEISDENSENPENTTITDEEHITKVYQKLMDVDSDRDIVLHGGFSVNSDKIIFDQIHFRCEGLDKISIFGKHVKFNRCTFYLEAGFLEITGNCTFTDCILVAENRTCLVQKIGGNVSLIGCHWLGSVEVESHPVYQPEMDEFQVGDVIYRDVCRSTGENVNYFEPIPESEESSEEEEEEEETVEEKIEEKQEQPKLVIDEQAGGERVQVSEKVKKVENSMIEGNQVEV